MLKFASFRIGLFGFAASSLLREDKATGDEGIGNYGTFISHLISGALFTIIRPA